MKKLNLLLHCGARIATLEDVAAVATPEATKSWVPIPHIELLTLVEEALKEGGHEIIQQVHALDKEGQRYFSMMQLANQNESSGSVVGMRNSHDKIFPAGLVIGDGLFVCDNLAWSGEIKLARRHTRYIRRDLPGLVYGGIGRLMNMRGLAAKREQRYHEKVLTDQEAHHLIIKAVDARVMANSRIPKVLQEWREPTYSDFQDRNLWSLYNGFTHVLKDSNIFQKPQASAALHGILDQWAN